MNSDTCGVCNLEIVHLLQNSPVSLQQDVLQAELPERAAVVIPRTQSAHLGQSHSFSGSQRQ